MYQILLFAIMLLPLNGWWCFGHMTIAQIAKSKMSAQTIQYLENTFSTMSKADDFPESPDFIQSACWADDLKTFKLEAMESWHFINRPYNPDGTPIPGGPIQEENVESLLMQLDTTMKDAKNDYILNFALANLIHFYGDSHQPLHVIELFSSDYPNGDHGGNAQVVHVNGNETKLHFIWDSICWLYPNSPDRPLSDSDRTKIVNYANYLISTYQFSDSLVKVYNSTVITLEGYADAIKYAYPNTYNGMTITQEYLDKCKPVAEGRVTLAGLRLGTQLEFLLRNKLDRPKKDLAKDIHRFIFNQRQNVARHIRNSKLRSLSK